MSSYLFVSYSSIYFSRFSMNILFAAFAAGGLKPSSHSPTYRVLICVALKRSGLIPCDFCRWWAQVDSNHRPRAYQARALTTWAMSPFSFGISRSLSPLVEMMGIEPMTPCLQGRCSPSWATPPYRVNEKWRVKNEEWKVLVEKSFAFFFLNYSLFIIHHSLFIILSFPSVTQNRTTSESTPLKCTLAVFLVFAYLQTFDVTATLLLYITFSIERRWSSRTFRYGYLVTT